MFMRRTSRGRARPRLGREQDTIAPVSMSTTEWTRRRGIAHRLWWGNATARCQIARVAPRNRGLLRYVRQEEWAEKAPFFVRSKTVERDQTSPGNAGFL